VIEDQSGSEGKAEPDRAEGVEGQRAAEGTEGTEVRGAGRVMTDQGIAGGMRKGGAKAEPSARRPEWEPGDHHTKAELEIRKPKTDPSSWAEPPKEEPKG